MDDAFCLQQLKLCDLFRELSEQDLLALYALMIKVHINAGETVIKQGEMSDNLHVVLSGKLLAQTSDGNVVGQINRGQTVGEMGLITQEPRSATVLAVRDCWLLRLDKTDFQQIYEKHPSVLLGITKMIAQRLQKNLNLGQKQYNRDSNIVIFPGHRAVNTALFMQQLSASFDKNFSYKILRYSDFSPTSSLADLYSAIQEVENQFDYVFYEIGKNQEWQELCLGRADRILVIVNAHECPVLDKDVLTGLNQNKKQSNIKNILVLLHEVWAPPSNTSVWLEQMQFVQHHHVCLHQKEHFSRLLRFVNGSAVGLVLSGGGTRGWVHEGVIKHLFEQNISIDACAGTSAGALNAALFLFSRDYQDFEEASRTAFRLLKFNEFTIPLVSLLSSSSLTTLLKTLFGKTEVEDLHKMLFCVAADLLSASEINIHRGPLWRAVRASVAIPGIYPPVYDDGRILVDGGIVNNLPVDVMRNYFEGFGKIIAVNISEMSEPLVKYNYPLELSWQWLLRYKMFSRRAEFELPSITGTLMKGMMLSSRKRATINQEMSDLCISPVLSGFGFLDSSKKESLIEIGYAAAQTSLQNWR